MASLTFGATAVRRIITHAKSAPSHHMGWSEYLPQPAVILVGDQGVYLMSNGEPPLKHRTGSNRNFVAFAKGINPYCDPNWWQAKRESFGADDGTECLLIIDDLQLLIDRGEEDIRLEITDDHTGLLMPDVSWAKPGAIVSVPSGLSGSFRARVEEITEIDALVQNTGNAGDFDDAPPYRVPLAQLRMLKNEGAA